MPDNVLYLTLRTQVHTHPFHLLTTRSSLPTPQVPHSGLLQVCHHHAVKLHW